MKKIFMIMTLILLIVFVSCTIYNDETYTVSESVIEINNAFKNDSTLTIDTLDLVLVESLYKDYDETWVDSTNSWFDSPYIISDIDTAMGAINTISDTTSTGADTTIYDTTWIYTEIFEPDTTLLDTIGQRIITPKDISSNKYIFNISTSKSGYAVLDLSSESAEIDIDIIVNDFFSITVWETDGTILNFDKHRIPFETFNYSENVIKEHYVYKMKNEIYILQFNPSENVELADPQVLVVKNYDNEL